ncbi:hypothetical protein [Rhodococcus sp. NPDC058521]|uniref:hypothetical protein n=1 Tax=Rhodococcus sp. NPDC058521 TaxID=3346536 RepID=UPI003647B409
MTKFIAQTMSIAATDLSALAAAERAAGVWLVARRRPTAADESVVRRYRGCPR